jgi:TM2 domain-containing membrane protein YozV
MPFCRNCGAEYTEGAKFCQKCGTSLTAQPTVTYVAAAPRKDAGVTALIAGLVGIFLFGIGHFYVGKIGRGILFLVVGVVVKIVFAGTYLIGMLQLVFGTSGWGFGAFVLIGLLNLGLWIWQIYDAYALANKYNSEAERTGKPPW